MKLTVAAVGRVRTPHFAAACDDYLARLKRYATLDVVEVRDVKNQPPDEIARRESRALAEAVPERAYLVALDERGELVSSVRLAQRLERAATSGNSTWAFCVGGAEGHDPAFRDGADWVWSLSPLTLPHELARVVLAEQLYRAMTIVRGERYHREG